MSRVSKLLIVVDKCMHFERCGIEKKMENRNMKFRKKPVVIEAFQLTKDFIMETCNDSKGLKMNGDGTISIPTLEGEMLANIGDWIITGVKGERYTCKQDIFEATYEPAE